MAIIKEKGAVRNKSVRQRMEQTGYNGSYRKVALQASGNLVGDLQSIIVGDKVEVSYQVTAREWQGKWYNNVDLYRVQRIEAQQPKSTPLVPSGSTEPVEGDLPF